MKWCLWVPLTAALPADDLENINNSIQSAINQFDEVVFGCHNKVRDHKRLVKYAESDLHHADVEVGGVTATLTKSLGNQHALSTELGGTKFKRLEHILHCDQIKDSKLDQLKSLKNDIDLATEMRDIVDCGNGTPDPATKQGAFAVCDEKVVRLMLLPGHPSVASQRKALLELVGGPKKCVIGDDVRCGSLTDAVSSLHGAARDNTQIIRAQIEAHLEFCKKQLGNMDDATVIAAHRLEGTGEDIAVQASRNVEARQHQADMHVRKHKAKQIHEDAVSFCKDRIADLSFKIENLKRHRAKGFPNTMPMDCVLSDWMPRGHCTVSCGAGGQRLFTRTIIQAAHNGAACNALERHEPCNTDRCPEDCELSEWESWTACTASCNGGIRTRRRSVVRKPRNGGIVCHSLNEVQPCGTGACDVACELGEWAPWGDAMCTRVCGDGGLRKRQHTMVTPGRGALENKCDVGEEYGPCELKPCPSLRESRKCKRDAVDVVLVLDASGSLTDEEFTAQISRAKQLRELFPANTVAVVSYSDEAQVLVPFEEDGFEKNAFSRLRGGTRLSLGLFKAQNLLSRGMGERPSVVIYTIEAKGPYSLLTTQKAFQGLRDHNVKVIGVLIGERDAPWAKEVVSEPSQEHLLRVNSFAAIRVWDIFVRACPSI